MMSPSTTVLDDERIAQLERELQESRDNEQTSKAALRQVHQDLKQAYLQVAQLKQKLDIVTKKLRSIQKSADITAIAKRDIPSERKPAQESLPIPAKPSPHLRPLQEGEAAARVNQLWQQRPSWTKGMILFNDTHFLDGLIREVHPDEVYEVGVASGTSSALILSSMAAYSDPSKIWLHSWDITDTCYFDSERAVGDATRAMVPHLLKQWKLSIGTALDVPRARDPKIKPLYFIDANHSHPWPTLDLIALLPALSPGDHVVLHDINLFASFGGEFPDFGVQWLFEDWLGESIVPDVPLPNIGAIIIPEDKAVIRASLEKTLSRPWPLQMTTTDAHVLACEKCLADFLRDA